MVQLQARGPGAGEPPAPGGRPRREAGEKHVSRLQGWGREKGEFPLPPPPVPRRPRGSGRAPTPPWEGCLLTEPTHSNADLTWGHPGTLLSCLGTPGPVTPPLPITGTGDACAATVTGAES